MTVKAIMQVSRLLEARLVALVDTLPADRDGLARSFASDIDEIKFNTRNDLSNPKYCLKFRIICSNK